MQLDYKKLSQIPTVPAIVLRLIEALNDPDLPITKITEIIKTDPAITTKIIKAANSPMYGGGGKVDSLERCVNRLGKNAVGCLALSMSLGDAMSKPRNHEQAIRETWLQSVIQGLAMEVLAKRTRQNDASSAFVGGLFLDVGRLALVHYHADEYCPIVEQARSNHRRLADLELASLSLTHAEVSAALLEIWQLPESIRTLAFNHELSLEQLANMRQQSDFNLIALANAAGATSDFLFGMGPAAALIRLETILHEYFKFEKPQIDEYLDEIRRKLAETSELFATDLNRLPSEAQLMALAMEQIANFAVRSALEAAGGSGRQLQKENENIRLRLQQLERRACVDNLTQVYTREYFDSRLDERLRAIQGDRTVGVLFADIDYFKRLNDTYGHLVGDEVLKQVGNAIKGEFRADDVVARFGGEEFVILIDCPQRDHIAKIAERVRRKVESTPVVDGDQTISVTISVGGVMTIPNAKEEEIGALKKQLVALADEAMYECKRGGKNRCIVKELTANALVEITETASA